MGGKRVWEGRASRQRMIHTIRRLPVLRAGVRFTCTLRWKAGLCKMCRSPFSYQRVCWLPENQRFLRAWRLCEQETARPPPTDPREGWSPGWWAATQTHREDINYKIFLIFLLLLLCKYSYFKCWVEENQSQIPCLSTQSRQNKDDSKCYSGSCFAGQISAPIYLHPYATDRLYISISNTEWTQWIYSLLTAEFC